MFDFKNEPEPSIEGLKISELTVAQFRKVMRECLAVGRADERGPQMPGLPAGMAPSESAPDSWLYGRNSIYK
jgi:hypothetical protein